MIKITKIKIVKLLYMLSAVIMGVGTFFGLITVFFNSGSGFLSKDNKPFALLIALVTIIGVTLFLLLGKLIFKSFEYALPTLGLIFICCVLTLPTIQAGYELNDVYRKFYAKHYTDKYVSQLRDIFTKGKFDFDYNQSNYETLYYGDLNRLEFEKNDENRLTTEEIDKLLLSLPLNNKGYRVSIVFGKHYLEQERRISSIAIFLDQNKMPTTCIVDSENYSLCDKYEED